MDQVYARREHYDEVTISSSPLHVDIAFMIVKLHHKNNDLCLKRECAQRQSAYGTINDVIKDNLSPGKNYHIKINFYDRKGGSIGRTLYCDFRTGKLAITVIHEGITVAH